MVSNWFTGLRSKTKIALEIIRTICIRCNCNQSVESSWFLLILIINEYEDKNHWKRPPSLSSCSTGTVTFLCLFKNNDWLLCRWLCCWWRFKGAGVRASGRSPPLPLYNRPFLPFSITSSYIITSGRCYYCLSLGSRGREKDYLFNRIQD